MPKRKTSAATQPGNRRRSIRGANSLPTLAEILNRPSALTVFITGAGEMLHLFERVIERYKKSSPDYRNVRLSLCVLCACVRSVRGVWYPDIPPLA